jgi:hypothetical protein
MRLWKLTPAADADDPRWLNAPVWREVVVRAATAGEARKFAADWEADKLGHSPTEDAAGGLAMERASALVDPVLYALHEMELSAGAPGVVGASAPAGERGQAAWRKLLAGTDVR